MTNRLVHALSPYRVPILVAAAIGLGSVSLVQAAPPAFEVISVKAHQADDNHRSPPQFLPGGRFTTAGVPLKMVIAFAYNVGFQSNRVTGGPAWINARDGTYDIEATSPKGAFPPGMANSVRLEKMRAMVQTLLADRFQLKIRREDKEIPIYSVVVAKNGPKLEKSKIDEKDCPGPDGPVTGGVTCHSFMGGRGRGLHGEAVTLDDTLLYVENWTDRPLVDHTGIQGLFNIQTKAWLDLQPGQTPPPGAKGEDGTELADMPTLYQVFETLGLKMEATKGRADIYVIDDIQKPASN
jgi:uncharacterized protein (TIGR03435 family)